MEALLTVPPFRALTEVTVAALLTERLAKMVLPTHQHLRQAMADGQEAQTEEKAQRPYRHPLPLLREREATEAMAAEVLVLAAML